MSNTKPQGGKFGGLSSENPNCAKCGKRHLGEFLMGLGNCFGCGTNGHMVKDRPMYKT